MDVENCFDMFYCGFCENYLTFMVPKNYVSHLEKHRLEGKKGILFNYDLINLYIVEKFK